MLTYLFIPKFLNGSGYFVARSKDEIGIDGGVLVAVVTGHLLTDVGGYFIWVKRSLLVASKNLTWVKK